MAKTTEFSKELDTLLKDAEWDKDKTVKAYILGKIEEKDVNLFYISRDYLPNSDIAADLIAITDKVFFGLSVLKIKTGGYMLTDIVYRLKDLDFIKTDCQVNGVIISFGFKQTQQYLMSDITANKDKLLGFTNDVQKFL